MLAVGSIGQLTGGDVGLNQPQVMQFTRGRYRGQAHAPSPAPDRARRLCRACSAGRQPPPRWAETEEMQTMLPVLLSHDRDNRL